MVLHIDIHIYKYIYIYINPYIFITLNPKYRIKQHKACAERQHARKDTDRGHRQSKADNSENCSMEENGKEEGGKGLQHSEH